MKTALLLLLLVACDRPRLNSGGSCTLNSDCAAPLVCQLDKCRRQCFDSRDCGAGLRCLALEHELVDGGVGGACQLPEETGCTLTSECPTGLVCGFGTCTTECVQDRDCTGSALCMHPDGGINACVEPLTTLCIYNSDCPPPEICGADQLCHIECNTDRDCISPRVCQMSRCSLYDGGP